MLCKRTHINKFRLNCVQSYDSNRIKRWIEFALLKGVSELDVFNSQFNSSVTQQIFVCATLVVLKLPGKFEMKLPESYFLPNLKFLQLKSGCFPKNFPLNRLMSVCPMLEDLVLGGRWGDDVKVINISSPTLINLTMNFITTSNYDRPRTDVLLDLPNLLYFNYEDILAIHYSMNLNSLVDARIRTALTGRRYDPDDESPQNFSDSMIELLKGVSSAKHLYLSGGLQALSFGEDKLPSFHLGEYKRFPSFNHLSCLDIDLSSQCGIWEHFLLAFLHSSPMLENLVIPGGLPASSFIYVSKSKSKSRSKICFWDGLKTPPSCLSSHLKTITIGSFHAQEYEELGVTKYFLKYGKVLTKLILYCKLKSEKEYTELKQLFKIGRLASKKCSLDLLNDDTT
uniref:FBD domain-containing protein n=2 Tax=Chenopodium quinoa TaxID=63459 RepID=A0A803LNF0_CHEQI